MTMLEIYKSRRSNLILRIKESKSLYETGSVISEIFETMQYQYLSQPGNDDLTEKLTQLINFAKSAFPLIESVSVYRLWQNADGTPQKKKNLLPGFIAMLAGVAMVFVTLGYYMFLNNIAFEDMQSYMLVMAAGCLVILISGFMLFHRRKNKTKPVVEISADADDIASRLEEIVKNIDDMLEKERIRQKHQTMLMESAINDDEVQLFSYLMEAKLSGEADYALEQLDEVEHYLAKQDVILVNYTKGNEKYFEFLEGSDTRTIRPAFVRRGEIMKKGLAQLKTE